MILQRLCRWSIWASPYNILCGIIHVESQLISVSGPGLSPTHGNEKITWVVMGLDDKTSLSTPVLELGIAMELGKAADTSVWLCLVTSQHFSKWPIKCQRAALRFRMYLITQGLSSHHIAEIKFNVAAVKQHISYFFYLLWWGFFGTLLPVTGEMLCRKQVWEDGFGCTKPTFALCHLWGRHNCLYPSSKWDMLLLHTSSTL